MNLIIIIFIILILLLLILNKLKKSCLNKLNTLIQDNKIIAFKKLINKWYIKLLIKQSVINNFNLQAALIEKDNLSVIQSINNIEAYTNDQQQLANLYLTGFNYFVSTNNQVEAWNLLNKIKTINNDDMIKEASRVYNICLKKSDEDLNDLLNELDNLENDKKCVNEFLISLIYANKNDIANQQKYENLFKQHSTNKEKELNQ